MKIINQKNETRRLKKIKAYHYSKNRKYSNLYGYKLDESGNPYMIKDEAILIRLVIGSIASGIPIKHIAWYLEEEGMRTRSGKRWTVKMLAALVKPIYTGRIRNRWGIWIKSPYYSKFVSVRTYKRAKKAVERLFPPQKEAKKIA